MEHSSACNITVIFCFQLHPPFECAPSTNLSPATVSLAKLRLDSVLVGRFLSHFSNRFFFIMMARSAFVCEIWKPELAPSRFGAHVGTTHAYMR